MCIHSSKMQARLQKAIEDYKETDNRPRVDVNRLWWEYIVPDIVGQIEANYQTFSYTQLFDLQLGDLAELHDISERCGLLMHFEIFMKQGKSPFVLEKYITFYFDVAE